MRNSARTERRVVVVGGGVGGFVAALALQRQPGIDVTLIEQAPRLGWVGAAINLTPNSVKALDGLGIGPDLRRLGFAPQHRVTRDWASGEVTGQMDMGSGAEERFGAPELLMHRAALLDLVGGAVTCPVLLGRRVVGLDQRPDNEMTVTCESGEEFRADVVVGADGIHSKVRACLLGEGLPTYTGTIGYRTFAARDTLGGPFLDGFLKWTRPDPKWNLVMFPISAEQLFIFASAPDIDGGRESWSREGSIEEVRELFSAYHPEARQPFDHCGPVLATALHVRDPLETWTRGGVALLGDACHPMTPYLAQGGAMAIEDGVVLARALAAATDVSAALSTYQRTRRDRVAMIQRRSNANAFRPAETTDVAPLYSFNAWEVPLDLATDRS